MAPSTLGHHPFACRSFALLRLSCMPCFDHPITPLCRSSHSNRELGVSRLQSKGDGCFVNGCEGDVEWVGWWYCADGARHLTESCHVHSDHEDFTPVTRYASAASSHVSRTPNEREMIVLMNGGA
jgi:hypothetical protein